jgi:hypothetical protein
MRHLRHRLFLLTDRFRRRRMRDFVETFDPGPETTILDVGGTETNWTFVEMPSEIVLLNSVDHPNPETLPRNLHWVEGDGRKLDYADDAFDLCFSNSTIEHLHTYADQGRFAGEIRRVAPSYYVQTPARSFPFEPHWLGFGIHWLPRAWQRRLVRYVTLYGLVAKPTKAQIAQLVDEYRLLSGRELRQLFPDAEIRRERFLLMTKSYVAVRRGVAH